MPEETPPVNYEVPKTGGDKPEPDFSSQEPETPPATGGHPELAITKPAQTKSKKKLILIIVAVVLVLAGAAAAAYWYMQNNKEEPTPATNTNTQVPATEEPAKPEVLTPDTIAYVFRENFEQPYDVFWRPAEGGDKTKAMDLKNGVYSGNHAVRGNNVALISGPSVSSKEKTGIWHSKDGGRTYKLVYSVPDGTANGAVYEIASIVFSSDSSTLVFGLVRPDGGSDAVALNLDTLSTETLFGTQEKRGLFIKAYETSSKKVIYTEGCYGCDGNLGNTVYMRDLTNETNVKLAESTATSIVEFSDVNKEFSEVLFKTATKDDNIKPAESLGYFYLGPPYGLLTVNLSDLSQKPVEQFGTKLELNADGTLTYLYTASGYMADGVTPYFALDNQLFAMIAGQKTLMYEADKSLQGVYFVSADNVLASSGEYDDFLLNNYSIKDKKSTIILNGNAETRIFGVTTK